MHEPFSVLQSYKLDNRGIDREERHTRHWRSSSVVNIYPCIVSMMRIISTRERERERERERDANVPPAENELLRDEGNAGIAIGFELPLATVIGLLEGLEEVELELVVCSTCAIT